MPPMWKHNTGSGIDPFVQPLARLTLTAADRNNADLIRRGFQVWRSPARFWPAFPK